MNTLLTEAFNKAQNLPDDLQSELAKQLIEDIENELKWQQTLSEPQHSKLEELAAKGTLPSTNGYTFPPGPEGTNLADFNYAASQAPTPPISATPSPAITSAVSPPAITNINPATGLPSSFSSAFESTTGAGIPPSPPMPAAPPTVAPPVASPPPGITSVPSPDPYALSKPPASNPYMSRLGDTYNFTNPSVSLGDQYAANAGRGTFSGMAEATAAPAQPTSAFERGLDKAMAFAQKNPLTAAGIAYTGASMLGLTRPNYGDFNNAPYDGPLSKYKLSPNYKATIANPSQYQYAPRYAQGGIMQMADGGVTASGNLTLNVPIGFGGDQNSTQSTPNYAFGNVNSGANTGFFGQNNTQVGASPSPQMQQPSILGQQASTPDLMQSLQQLKPDGQSAPINVGGPADVSQDQNQPQRFARGGSTGNLSSSLDYYTKMMEGETPKMPSSHPTDAGIYHDSDPDTRSLDPYSAARVRLAKTNKRAYVAAPSFPAPTPMGQLNLSPPGAKADGTQYLEAAKGGIMGLSDLGGYAAGGNPRLLKGPGDGMSDNIPATINGRQPARLADGEFVIPADVVSHLGNGSTDAGAKVLHQMMTKVRQERTGNPHQGKQINPRKYMPR